MSFDEIFNLTQRIDEGRKYIGLTADEVFSRKKTQKKVGPKTLYLVVGRGGGGEPAAIIICGTLGSELRLLLIARKKYQVLGMATGVRTTS